MTKINCATSSSITIEDKKNSLSKKSIKDDNIFANTARNAGLNSIASFLSDDWSANMARKMGFNNFADWIDNKPDENNKKDTGIISNIGREIVKHPFTTIAIVAGTFFAGKSIYNALAKNKSSAISNTPTNVGSKEILTDTVSNLSSTSGIANKKAQEITKIADDIPLKSLNEQIDELNQIISKGIDYERSIDYKNLEIFQNISDSERKRILASIELSKSEKDFLMFASGSKAATFQGRDLDIFDCLRSDKISVAELWGADKNRNLLLNQAEAKKIIEKHRGFFANRFELPETTSTDEILEMLSKGWKNKLSDTKKYADVRALLEGAIDKNAYFAQIYQDVFVSNMYNSMTLNKNIFKLADEDINLFKKLLKEFINSDKSAYKELSTTYKNKVYEMIDAITEKEFARKFKAMDKMFLTDDFKRKEIEMLKNLAQKLELAQKNGGKICLN